MSRIWILFALLSVGLVALARYVASPPAPTVPAGQAVRDTAEIEERIRRYILGHPEVLIQSVRGMSARESSKALQQLGKVLETPFPGAVAGNPNGDVTIVAFFDFRCPYCRTAHAEAKKLLAADPNVRIVYRDIPILDTPGQEPLSRRAAQLALAAAKQGKYKVFHDQVFSIRGRVTQESLVAAVRAAGMDERRAVTDMNSDEVRKAIEQNLKLARTIGIDVTPVFVIGSELHVGTKKMSELSAIVERVRARRQAELAQSSAR